MCLAVAIWRAAPDWAVLLVFTALSLRGLLLALPAKSNDTSVLSMTSCGRRGLWHSACVLHVRIGRSFRAGLDTFTPVVCLALLHARDRRGRFPGGVPFFVGGPYPWNSNPLAAGLFSRGLLMRHSPIFTFRQHESKNRICLFAPKRPDGHSTKTQEIVPKKNRAGGLFWAFAGPCLIAGRERGSFFLYVGDPPPGPIFGAGGFFGGGAPPKN